MHIPKRQKGEKRHRKFEKRGKMEPETLDRARKTGESQVLYPWKRSETELQRNHRTKIEKIHPFSKYRARSHAEG